MARLLYSLLLYLATPLIGLRLLWRAKKQPEYLEHLGERWGFYQQKPERPVLWVHAVSVGETRAAQPLIEALQARFPTHQILLTGMTPTGRATGQTVYGDTVRQAYLPYDYPDAVDRFFRHFSPDFGVLMETEIWPNLLAASQRRQVPIILANARLSARSARGYGKFSALAQPAFATLSGVAAQTANDAERLSALGAVNIAICGNLKFDVTPSQEMLTLGTQWRSAIGHRPTWLAASTREGEEELILSAWKAARLPDALLVLVPRHPQRFDTVSQLIERSGLSSQRRSHGLPNEHCAVWLGDSMGEMVAYYQLADLAFIGGSLLPLGGQNLIEAAACACPALVGPHTFNFQQATTDAIAAGAALRIENIENLTQTVRELLLNNEKRQEMASAARQFAEVHRGATTRTLALILRSTGPARR